MKRLAIRTLAAALMLAATVALAGDAGLTVAPGGRLWLTGTSTVHDYHANATKVTYAFQTSAPIAAPSASEAIEKLIREHGVTGLEVTVPVAGLQSGKDGLDKNMVKALKGEAHPVIRFVMTGYTVAEAAAAGTLALEAAGKLTVAGVECEVKIPVAAKLESGAWRLTGEVPLLMSQFGIKPPTMMMGTLRTGDKVVIHFDLAVGAGGAAAAENRP